MSGASLGKEEQINLKITAVVQACARTHIGSQRVMILLYLHDFSFIDFSHDITPVPGSFSPSALLCPVWVRICAKYQQLVSTQCVWLCVSGRQRERERKPVLGCVGKYVRGSLGLRDICGSHGSLLGYQFSPSIMRQ